MKAFFIPVLLLIAGACSYENPKELPKGPAVVPPIQALKMCADPTRWDPKWCKEV